MNKAAIKNYAIWARVQLIESAKQRAFEYEITENGENKANVDNIGGHLLSADEKEQRKQLIAQIQRKGYTQVMEEAAYTWFNRFIALRFMEVNGYLPSKIRVFTDENGSFKPEILKEAMTVELEGLDRSKVLDFLDKQNNEALYKYLIITQCNALNTGLPYMFEKIANWTELLFPANLLRGDSIIGQMISMIPEEDWTDAVQIIGWLYQYYNSELKDETFALLKKNVKISKERIPAATQLFTPDWIVRYMVENSLGRLWYEGHSDFDKSQWKYYLDEAEQETEVEKQLTKIRAEYANIRPEEIKVIDPCMGSGHILVYAFDLLMQIYTSAGWSERDAAKSIVENNLYGLDIDDRAGQLAYFAVMMKARKYSRRILNGDVRPNVLSIQDSSFMTDEFIAYVAGKDANMKADLVMLRKTFKDAKEYGSILNVSKMQYDELYERIDIISRSYAEDLFQTQYKMLTEQLLFPLVRQAEIMSQKYSVVITNPPYMGSSGMSSKLDSFVKGNYPATRSDLFAVFIEKCSYMTISGGFQAMITQHAWMFLASFLKLREKLQKIDTINMAHLGPRAFEEIAGEVVQTTSFVLRNSNVRSYNATYNRVIEANTQQAKEDLFLSRTNLYYATKTKFAAIPGEPIAYWVSDQFAVNYKEKPVGKFAEVITGMTIGDNNKYLRLWFEVSRKNIAIGKGSMDEINISETRWIPYSKGGTRRCWYGNYDYVVNWSQKANFNRSKTTLQHLYLKEAVTWPFITTGTFCARILPKGFLWDVAGSPCFFTDTATEYYTLGALCSNTMDYILKVVNPTINVQANDVAQLPLIFGEKSVTDKIVDLVNDNIEISRADWDSAETSWDFIRHPLARKSGKISDLFDEWTIECEKRFSTLKHNEESINQSFIEIYGLQRELSPRVDDKDITVSKADYKRDIKSLISYAVGCMFGRYSIDIDGLCYAGGEWDPSRYKTIIPDGDNIIPICDDDYFEDDIVGRFIDFIRKVYGEDSLEENLVFIANALGGSGTPRDIIRNYFLNDFYSDHCSMYSVSGSGKRPIYWLFSSGKKNGFKALAYMHRYQPDLLARMRTDYVHEQQERYRTQLQMLEDSLASAIPSERVKLNKQIAKLKEQALEIQKYEEKIHHLADQMVAIDLDEGVKVNYAKFQEVLEKIK